MHHGVTFSFGSAKVCSPDIWIAATDYFCVYLIVCIIVRFPINIYSPVNKFYSIMF